MNENQLKILRQEVDRLTNEIKKHEEELERLDVIRDVLQRELQLYQTKKNYGELPF